EALDSLGIQVSEAKIDVPATGTASPALLATPSRRTYLAALCPRIADSTNLGVLLGVVRHVEGATVSGAHVIASWNDFTVDTATARVDNKTYTTDGLADEHGVYRLCGLPVEHPLFVQAQETPGSQSGIIED